MGEAARSSMLDALVVALVEDSFPPVGDPVETAARRSELPAASWNRLDELAGAVDGVRRRQRLLRGLIAEILDGRTSRGLAEARAGLVRSARALLGAELAYLCRVDEDRQAISVGETEGVATEAFRGLRISESASVIGLTIPDGPVQSPDFLTDVIPNLNPDLAHVMRAEGIRGIAGAPMRIDGRTLGALFVADRSSRPFDADEISALETLARHGALMLADATLQETLRCELDAARAARDDAVAMLSELGRLRDAETRLLAASTPRGDEELFEAELGEILGTPALTVAADTTTLLLDRQRIPQAPPDLEAQLHAVLTTNDSVTFPVDEHGALFTMVPAAMGDHLLGAVGMHGAASAAQNAIMRQAAVTFGALLSSRRALELAGARERADVLQSLLTGRSTEEHPALTRRARALGVDLSDDIVIVIAEPVTGTTRRVQAVLENPGTGRGIVAAWQERVRAVLNAADAEDVAVRWARALAARGANATVAAELVTAQELAGGAGLAAIAAAHDSASAVLSTALALGRRGEPCTQAMLGMAALVISGDTTGATGRIVRYAVGPLLDHDEDHTTSLTETALAFLDANQRVADTAERLHVHENTVRQRIARIDTLLGTHWRRGPRSLDAHLALRLHQLSRSDRHMI